MPFSKRRQILHRYIHLSERAASIEYRNKQERGQALGSHQVTDTYQCQGSKSSGRDESDQNCPEEELPIRHERLHGLLSAWRNQEDESLQNQQSDHLSSVHGDRQILEAMQCLSLPQS